MQRTERSFEKNGCPTLLRPHVMEQFFGGIFNVILRLKIAKSLLGKVRSRVGHPFISKECSALCVLFRSFKKNGTFFAFFSVLLKRTERSLRSFPLFRTERSFRFHKLPKTREKNGKERNVIFFERKRTKRSERKRTRCPTLIYIDIYI